MSRQEEMAVPVPRTYERLLLFNVLVVVVEAPVDLVVLLPLCHVLDLLRPVVDGPVTIVTVLQISLSNLDFF
jgi:hypothetical protein